MKVLHHNDIDGYASARVIADFTKNFNEADYFVTDYSSGYQELIEELSQNETVYISDVSFTESTLHYLEEIMNITQDIIWCDHHNSSMALETDHPELKSIKGIRSLEYCGAMLTYMYLNNADERNVPPLIRYVDDYDCWKWNMQETLYFKYGMETEELDINSPVFRNMKNVLDIISKGQIVGKYQSLQDISTIKNMMFPYVWTVNDTNYNCFICNYSKSGSLLFKECIDDCDIAITFSYNGKKWKYGLYSNKDHVDCSKIAEVFGGGGHKRSAGFTADTFLFENKEKVLWGKEKNIWEK